MALLRDAWVAQMHQVPHTQVEQVDCAGMIVLRLVGDIQPLQAKQILVTLKVHSATQIEWWGKDFIIVRWRLFELGALGL